MHHNEKQSTGYSTHIAQSGNDQQQNTYKYGSKETERKSKIPVRQKSGNLGSCVSEESLVIDSSKLDILIVGKLGSGKSATGNTICGTQKFKSQFSGASTTTDCQNVSCLQESVERYISVVDTPTLFEIQDQEVKFNHKISKLFHQDPEKSFHVILLVIAAGRFTHEDDKTVRLFLDNFGEPVEMCTIIVFSHEDRIGINIDEFFKPVPEILDCFFDKFDRRFIGFNNKSTDANQVKQLFAVIDEMMFKNGRKKYSSKDFLEAQKKLKSKSLDNGVSYELDERTKAQLRTEEKFKIEQKIKEEKQKTKEEQKMNTLERHYDMQSEHQRDNKHDKKEKGMPLLVAALDVGTSYSGYAYAFIDDSNTAPQKIFTHQHLNLSGNLTSKIPTCLLLNKKKEFVSFGYDAEKDYGDIMIDNEQANFYFFSRFKMILHEKNINSQMEVKDVTGKSLLAIEVFGLTIKALATHLEDTLEKQDIKNRVKQWVLTVPAIWSDAAKQFMRKCAIKGGIPNACLRIALEPEAASIYCQYLTTKKANLYCSIADIGTRYMVVDLGGGTVDVNVHEKLANGQLKELARATGNGCGGIDDRFLQMLGEIFGDESMQNLKEKYLSEYFDLIRSFEAIKRTVSYKEKSRVLINIPLACLSELCTAIYGENLQDRVCSSIYGKYLDLRRDKIRINDCIIQSLFREFIESTVSLIKHILKNDETSGVSTILLVGALSKCQLIRDSFIEQFPDKLVIISEEADLFIVKGSVLFGYRQDL